MFGLEALNRAVQAQVSGGLIERRGELDGITFFDKVIQIRNRPASDQAYAWMVDAKKNTRVEVFNGELGFVKVHGLDTKTWKAPLLPLRQISGLFLTQTEPLGELWPQAGLHLAREWESNAGFRTRKLKTIWNSHTRSRCTRRRAASFDRTYVIVPKSKGTMLSPELVYTALTRAKQHCTLFVERDVTALLASRRRERSSLLRINSSLFEFHAVHAVAAPLLQFSSFDAGRIHESLLDAWFARNQKSSLPICLPPKT